MNTEILSLVPQEKREAAQAYLKTREAYPPKLVQGMLLVGALISCVAILFGGTVLFGVRVPRSVIGVVFTAAGWWLSAKNEGRADWAYVFCAQLGLVLGIIGRMELMDWLVSFSHYAREGNAFIFCAVAVLSYPFFKAKIDRLFFCTWALVALLDYTQNGLLRSAAGMEILSAVLCALFFGGALWIFASRRIVLKPLAYAGVIACGVGLVCLSDTVGRNLSLVLFAGMAAFCASRLSVPFKMRALICALIVVLACWLPVYAFAGLFACAAGYCLRERLLEWVGMAGFAAGLVWMYYDMNTTLLVKSGWLTLAGVCVLAAYAWVRRKYAR
ncbi:MAG: DUF4401 domain-containing protein [Elusimicrobiales bacterium]|nr:DUF4401 domain-containing protein [Elusimicrobiales bacterium]